MPFNNPKQRIAAILSMRKKTMGPMPKNPNAPMNSISNSPNMVPPNPLTPMSNPMAPATMNMAKPSINGFGRFGKIKKLF